VIYKAVRSPAAVLTVSKNVLSCFIQAFSISRKSRPFVVTVAKRDDRFAVNQALEADSKLRPRVEELVKAANDRRRRAGERAGAIDATVGEALDAIDRLLKRLR